MEVKNRIRDRVGAHADFPPETQTNRSDGSKAEGGPAAVKQVASQFGELFEYASLYASATRDKVGAKFRKILALAVLGVAGSIALVGLIFTAVAYFLQGIAGGLAELLPFWAANLIVGGAILALIFGGIFVATNLWSKKSKERTVAKYERRLRQQRARFGRTSEEQATRQGSV